VLSSRPRPHDAPGLVSLVVLNAEEREEKEKLIAIKGQLVTVVEVLGDLPNGTAFAITTGPAPELDATNLVVGRVVEGQEVVEALAAIPRVKDNSGSAFFQAGKAAGDKRADVAERAFGRPFAKVVIWESGVL
jgi:peptidyl-prolyl cis-trans isomerase B (cyclophilin B)